MKRYICLISVALFAAANAAGIAAERLWDMVVVDVSGDMEWKSPKSGKTEADGRDAVTDELIRLGYRDVPALIFAEGRLLTTLGDFADMKYKASENVSAFALGFGSPIYESVAATLNAGPRPERVLLLSNGRVTGSGISAPTCARVLAPYGVTVDAVQLSLDCDSVLMADHHIMPYSDVGEGMKTLAGMSGGCYACIIEGDDAGRKLASLICECEKKEPQVVAECGLDEGMMDRYVASLPVSRFIIEEVPADQVLEFNDVIYDGLEGLREAAGLQDDSEAGIVGIVKAPGGGEYFLLDEDTASLAKRKKALTVWLAEHKANGLDTTLPLDFFPLVYYSGKGDRLQICGLWKSSRDELEEEEEEE